MRQAIRQMLEPEATTTDILTKQYRTFREIPRICYGCGTLQSAKWTMNLPTTFVLCGNCRHIICRDRDRQYCRNRILFKGKRIHVPNSPRKGICMQCGKTGRTNLHHQRYNDDALKHTVELCIKCHLEESISLGQIDMISARQKAIMAIKRKWANVA